MSLETNLEDLKPGTHFYQIVSPRDHSITRVIPCDVCSGKGKICLLENNYTCPKCQGKQQHTQSLTQPVLARRLLLVKFNEHRFGSKPTVRFNLVVDRKFLEDHQINIHYYTEGVNYTIGELRDHIKRQRIFLKYEDALATLNLRIEKSLNRKRAK